jgi:hypothetical protein
MNKTCYREGEEPMSINELPVTLQQNSPEIYETAVKIISEGYAIGSQEFFDEVLCSYIYEAIENNWPTDLEWCLQQPNVFEMIEEYVTNPSYGISSDPLCLAVELNNIEMIDLIFKYRLKFDSLDDILIEVAHNCQVNLETIEHLLTYYPNCLFSEEFFQKILDVLNFYYSRAGDVARMQHEAKILLLLAQHQANVCDQLSEEDCASRYL